MDPLQVRAERLLKGLDKSEGEIQEFTHKIKIKCIEVIRAKIDKFLNNLEEYLTKKFNNLFCKDEKGIPRDPKTANYDEIFASSKDKVLPILDQFKYFSLSPDWDMTDEFVQESLLGEEAFDKILEGFLKDAERTYKDALHIKEFGYNRGGIPKWALLLILFLGWNEILWVLQSPIILYPSIFIASIIALMFSMGLGDVPKLILNEILSKIPFLF